MSDATDAVPWRDAIDRDDPTPLYRQLEEVIRGEVARGGYPVGELLPSESSLCDRWDVSRTVVRQALKNLAQDGVIRTERGRGSFVAEQKLDERFVPSPSGFHEDLAGMGLTLATEVVRQEITEVPLEVEQFLGVSEAIRLDRVRSVDDRRLAYVVNYLPPARCPGLLDEDLTDRSLYELLRRRYGLAVRSGARYVESVAASDEVAVHLEVEVGTPVLLLRGAGRSADGRPLEWFEAWHRADRARFEVEISSDPQHRPLQPRVVEPAPGSDAPRPSRHARAAAPAAPWHASDVALALADVPVIAVLRAATYGAGDRIADGLTDGGIRVLEFTLTGSNALRAIEQAANSRDAIVGAGSVTSAAAAREAVDAGAQYLVCPILVPEVVNAQLRVPVILGGATPSELFEAWRLTGAPVKFFPVGGPEAVRAIQGPLPQVPLVPSGGIDPSNARRYLDAGAVALNVGTSLCPPDALAAADTGRLASNARELVAALGER